MQIKPIIHNHHHYNAGLSLVEEQVKCSRKSSSTSSFLSSGKYHKHIIPLTNLHNFCLFLLQLAVTQSLAPPEAADRIISLEGMCKTSLVLEIVFYLFHTGPYFLEFDPQFELPSSVPKVYATPALNRDNHIPIAVHLKGNIST